MRSYPVNEARAAFSKLIDRALAGEPQRVTRHGKDAVVIVSEADWKKGPRKYATLADLIVDTIGKGDPADALGGRDWGRDERPLGSDFSDQFEVYLLDTNIVSLFDPRPPAGAAPIIDWILRKEGQIYLSAITIIEIEAGVLKHSRAGNAARARELADFRDGFVADFAERILPVDVDVALRVAGLAEAVRPFVIERLDLMIAATAAVHGLTVVTRNVKHFAPTLVPCFDPLAGLP